MYITYYDYIDGDKLNYRQYFSKHYPYRNYRFWHFTYSSKRSWLKKSVLFNTFSLIGFFSLLYFLIGILTLCVEERDYWLSFGLLFVAIVVPLYDFICSYYYSFVKPRQIKVALQEFIESNRLELIEEHSLDRYLVRKDGYVFEVAYAYENIFIQNLFNRRDLLIVRLCYATTNPLLINQHGLVTLPFERQFKEYCSTLQLDSYLFLDEHQISAAYPMNSSSSATSTVIESVIDVLTHFGLSAIAPDSFSRFCHYTIGGDHKTLKSTLYALCIIFVYIAVIIVCLYLGNNHQYSTRGFPESDPIDRISEYFLIQNDIDLEKYEPDTLLSMPPYRMILLTNEVRYAYRLTRKKR